MSDSQDFMNFTHPLPIRQSPTTSRRTQRISSSRRTQSPKAMTARSTTYMTSTARMQPYLDGWDSLSKSIHNFSNKCFINETNTEFLTQFARAEHQFNDFNRHAKTIFNNLRPSKELVIRPSSAILKVANLIVKEYQQFIVLFCSIASGGVQNQFELMNKKYSQLSQHAYQIGLRFSEPDPLFAISAVKKVKAYIDFIKKTADQQSRSCLLYNSDRFNEELFTQRLNELYNSVINLFETVMPKSSLGINGFHSTKRDVLLLNEQIKNLFDGILNFNSIAGESKIPIEMMNKQFDKMFEVLNIPIRLTNADDINQETKENLQKVDDIQANINEIKEIINNETQ